MLAGCAPAALICELMHEDGVMMKRPGCMQLAREYGLPIITTAQIVEFRRTRQGGCSPPSPIATPLDAAAFVQARGDPIYSSHSRKLPI